MALLVITAVVVWGIILLVVTLNVGGRLIYPQNRFNKE